jgi:hypothetical protein
MQEICEIDIKLGYFLNIYQIVEIIGTNRPYKFVKPLIKYILL